MSWKILAASGVLMTVGGLGWCLRRERKLRRRNEKLIMFYASLGHELKTPLNAILGFTELLQSGGFEREEQRQFARNISLSAHALLDMVNRMLDCAKLNAGQLQCRRFPIDLEQLVRGLQIQLSPLLLEKNLRLEIDVPNHLPQLELDPELIRRILLNLLGNAIKFSDRGDIALRCSFEAADRCRGRLTLKVIDDGPGIAEEYRRKIFDPFVRDHRHAASGGGTGLGLYITMQLVRLMHGSLELESGTGKGCCFTVTIPGIKYTPEASSLR